MSEDEADFTDNDEADASMEPQNRSPAPDAAPEDNPEPDALKGVDIKSGTGDAELEHPTQSGEAGPAAGTSPGTAGGP